MPTSIWKGSISFGLLNIPVQLQGAEDNQDHVSFSMLDKKDNSHIRYKKVNEKTGREVPYANIVKGYEYQKGKFVIMDEKDFQKANPKATQSIDIEDFVLMEEVDPVYFDKPYFLVPQKGAEKGYLLLREALEKTDKVAIGKIVIRVKQHLAMIMPRGKFLVLELLRFGHEIKEDKEVRSAEKLLTAKKNFSAKELQMAEALIDGMTSKWNPDAYKDTYYSEIKKAIQLKIKKGKGKKVEEVEDDLPEETSNVIDLMPLLKKSLEGRKTKKRTVKKKATRKAAAH